MAEDNTNLDMNMFSDSPIIDLNIDEGEDLLFLDEDQGEEIGSEEDQQENENITNEDQEDPENVVGTDNNQDETEEIENSDESEADEDSSPTPNLFSSLTALLTEKGLLSSVDSDLKIEDEDSFAELIKEEIKKNEYSDLTDSQKLYLEKLRNGIPEEEVKEVIKTSEQLNSITEDHIKNDQNLRQRIIYQDYINRGFNDAKARQLLQRSIELELDVDDAKEALESIKEFSSKQFETREQELAKQKEAQLKAEEDRINEIKNKIKSTSEIIKGFTITDNVKEKIEKNMFDIVGESPTGQKENALMKYARENRTDFDTKLYYLYTITNGFQNFDIIEKNSKSKSIKDLERAINSTTKIKDSSGPTFLQDPESKYVDILGHELP